MRYLILLLFIPSIAFGQFTNVQKSFSTLINLMDNPGFENGVQKWTVAGGDTISVTTTAANVGSGSAALSWNSAGANRTVTSAAFTIPAGMYGHSAVVSCNIQTPSGTATHTIEAWDGSGTIGTAKTVTSATTYTRTITAPFTMPSSGTIAIRLKSINANEPQIYVDDCIVGDAQLLNLLPMPTPVAPWWIEAQQYTTDTTHFSLPTSGTTSSWTEITNAAVEVLPISGSAAVGTMCDTTNAATSPSSSATTCAAGSESLGINFSIPAAGPYEVCFRGSLQFYASSGASVNDNFAINETPTNAQTVTTQGKNTAYHAIVGMIITGGVNSAVGDTINICEIFNWTTSGTKAVRLMFRGNVSSSTSHQIYGPLDNATYGDINPVWRVKPLSSNNYYSTTLLGSSSGAGGGITIKWLETGGNSPTNDVYSTSDVYLFDNGLAQELYTSFKVPTSYTAGLPIKLKLVYSSADTSGTILFTTVATLLGKDATAFTSTTNQRTSTNSAATLSGTANRINEVICDLTNTDGTINSVAVAPGDVIKVKLTRGTDTATSQVRLHKNSYEVTLQ